ncbi:arsenic metallochaperone ArsD family protein [Helcobacillus massiliensis]|uniref:Arsenical resistance operon trans-acting repressor ArsD n=1 Tax=Helcobacillus massiliensis TaxID=521392 RepID=A0A839QR69_9MICO|nr:MULTISPECIES: arsenic metallochaperone ArsD family protein [Helcobacillus]MBB3022158.1 hypothetical protein [Helcobacillus massiliensis]MCG7426777.1 arsenic metallochaperone ArsD family protein [Helcobacillus sp. ACRRO]MCT1557317.1 arsenic metallochaperone ArsD family protein [Helcobacillus massiliensis]MCT2036204.1 arsenic metallochaperone ArsD family protein [Helcobacillus massiliensis]MCT2331602.1 arsenic metallochaperone ArsD family protein [Helcobacillus massiliensis]
MNDVEIFIPGRESAEADGSLQERSEFLTTVEELRAEGLPILVYSTDDQPEAFTACEHVKDMIDVSGEDILPITLLGSEILGVYAYPTAEKMRRFATTEKDTPRGPSNACAPGRGSAGQGGADGTGEGTAPVGRQKPAGLAAMLRGPEPNAPDIGARRNLMGGDTGDGLPTPGGEESGR